MVRIPGGIGSIMTVRTGLVGAGAIVGIGRGRNELQRVREAPIRAFGATCFLRKGAVRRAPCAEASDASEASRGLEVDQMDQWIPLVAGFRVPKKEKGTRSYPGKRRKAER